MENSFEGKKDLFISADPPEIKSASNAEERERNWQIMADYFDNIKDRLGQPLDINIRETVTAFNLLGIKTQSSCGGHIRSYGEQQYTSPYVAFTDPALQSMKIELAGIQEQKEVKIYLLESKEEEDLQLEAEFYELDTKEGELQQKIQEVKSSEMLKVMRLLEEFYSQRQEQIPLQKMLILADKRIQNQGAPFINLLAPTEREKCLTEYQEEMKLFSNFLKNKYLQNSG